MKELHKNLLATPKSVFEIVDETGRSESQVRRWISSLGNIFHKMLDITIGSNRAKDNEEFYNGQFIVSAAIQDKNGRIICGARHFDPIMRQQIKSSEGVNHWRDAEQGFIDQYGKFLSRKEALVVARVNRQIVKRCGGDKKQLFSENLY